MPAQTYEFVWNSTGGGSGFWYPVEHEVGPMIWQGTDPTNTTFPRGAVVQSEGLLLVANKQTSEAIGVSEDDWDFLSWTTNSAAIGGNIASFSPGTSYTAITNWDTAVAIGVFETIPPVAATGIHTLPFAAEYKVTAQIIFSAGQHK